MPDPFDGLAIAPLGGVPEAIFANLTDLQVPDISDPHIAALTAGQFGRLLPPLIRAFSAQQSLRWRPEHLSAMEGPQGAAITRAQFDGLGVDRLPHLSAAAFGALDPVDCIARLSDPQVQVLSQAQIGALGGPQMARIPASLARKIGAGVARDMTRAQFEGLQPARLALVPGPVFAEFDPERCIAHMSALQAAELTPDQAAAMTQRQFEQLPALSLARVDRFSFIRLRPAECIAHISQEQARALVEDQFGRLTREQFQAFPPARLADVLPDIFAHINVLDGLPRISEQQAQEITPAQAAKITSGMVARMQYAVFGQMSGLAFAGLLDTVIRAMTHRHAEHFKNVQCAEMTQSQVENLDPLAFAAIKGPAFAALDPARCIAHLGVDRAARLSVAQAGAMVRAQFEALVPACLGRVGGAPFAALRHDECLEHISDDQVRAITGDQCAAMTQLQYLKLDNTKLPLLRATAFGRLRVAECISATTVQQARVITGDQAAEMTADQVNALHARWSDIPVLAFRRVLPDSIVTAGAARHHLFCADLAALTREGALRTTLLGSKWFMVRWGHPNYSLHVHLASNGTTFTWNSDKIRSNNMAQEIAVVIPAPMRQHIKENLRP
jgi:hypothetical protein